MTEIPKTHMTVRHQNSNTILGVCRTHDEAVNELKVLAAYSRQKWADDKGRETKTNPFLFFTPKASDTTSIPAFDGMYARWILEKTSVPVVVENNTETKKNTKADPYRIVGMELFQVTSTHTTGWWAKSVERKVEKMATFELCTLTKPTHDSICKIVKF